MKKWKSDFQYALVMLPVTAVATLFVLFYQLKLFGDQLEEMAAQVGGVPALMAIGLLQTCLMVFAACLVGHHLAVGLGIWKPLKFEKKPVLQVLALGLAFGLLMLGDHFLLGKIYPQIHEANAVGNTFVGVVSAVLYGGIVEELLLRLGFMTLVCWGLWKIFAGKAEAVPGWVFLIGNLLAALLFAAGHLPATVQLFGGFDVVLLLRCFLLNGGFGFFFGLLYVKYGLHYAMLAHLTCHLCFKLLLVLCL